MSEELKPCPFCGGEAVLREGTDNDGWKGFTAITCVDQKNPFCPSQWIEGSKKEAIEAWNRRKS